MSAVLHHGVATATAGCPWAYERPSRSGARPSNGSTDDMIEWRGRAWSGSPTSRRGLPREQGSSTPSARRRPSVIQHRGQGHGMPIDQRGSAPRMARDGARLLARLVAHPPPQPRQRRCARCMLPGIGAAAQRSLVRSAPSTSRTPSATRLVDARLDPADVEAWMAEPVTEADAARGHGLRPAADARGPRFSTTSSPSGRAGDATRCPSYEITRALGRARASRCPAFSPSLVYDRGHGQPGARVDRRDPPESVEEVLALGLTRPLATKEVAVVCDDPAGRRPVSELGRGGGRAPRGLRRLLVSGLRS